MENAPPPKKQYFLVIEEVTMTGVINATALKLILEVIALGNDLITLIPI